MANCESDATIVLSNDDFFNIVKKRINPKVDIETVNEVIGLHLAQIFTPPINFQELISSSIPMPNLNILSLRAIPQISAKHLKFSNYTWPQLLKYLRQMMLTNCPIEEGMNWDIGLDSTLHAKSLSTKLFLRGTGAKSLETRTLANQLFNDDRISVDWLENGHYEVLSSEKSFCGRYPISAGLLSNSVLPLKTNGDGILENIYDRAGALFTQGAFVHQYERYGVGSQEMLASFARYKTILNSYRVVGGNLKKNGIF